MGYIDYSSSGERSLVGHQSYLSTLAELTYKAMERRYRKAEKQCTQAGTAEGGGSLSRTGTGAIAVIQTSALLAVFAVLGFAVKRFSRYHSR